MKIKIKFKDLIKLDGVCFAINVYIKSFIWALKK